MRNDGTSAEQAERGKESHRFQAVLFSLQSDKSRLERKGNDLQAEIHRVKIEFSRLKIDIEEKEAVWRSLGQEMELLDEEIKRTKNHLNSL